MPNITTIFWDIGGVVLTNGWDEHQRAGVLTKFGVDMAVYEPLHHTANALWERGKMTADLYLDHTLFYEPQKFTRQEIWKAMEKESQVLTPEWFGLMEGLRASDKYTMATLNNESRELNDYRLETFGLRQYFDFFISSGYVGMMKPEPGIFLLALEISQSDPEQTLFVDDKQANVDMAREFGMNGIRFTSIDALRGELEKLGVTA